MRSPLVMRLGPVVLIGLLVLTAGCATSRTARGQTQPPSSGPVAVTSAGRLGTLTGLVTISGGPMTTDGRMALDHRPETDRLVTVDAAGRTVATTRTDATGHFSVSLPGGEYSVDAGCGSRPAMVVSGQTASVDMSCDVP